MAEVIGDMTVVGRAYLRDDTTGQFLAAVSKGSFEATHELGETLKQLIVGAIMGAGLYRSGELAGSVRSFMVGATESDVVSDSVHAAPLNFGAKAHWIPNAFGWGVAVWHPGNRAYRFFEAGSEVLSAIGGQIVAKNMP